ncbi:MAG: hypothetical protein ACX932_04375 [Gammaproteobacteria bacterium]
MAEGQQHPYDLWHYDMLYSEDNRVDEHGFSANDYEALEKSLDKAQCHRKNKHHKQRVTRQSLDTLIEQRRWDKQYNDLFGEL